MTIDEFYTLRLIYFFEKLEGHFDKITEDRKFLSLVVRRATTILYNTQIVERADLKEAHQLWPLPWDDENDGEEQEDDIPVEVIRGNNRSLIESLNNYNHAKK